MGQRHPVAGIGAAGDRWREQGRALHPEAVCIALSDMEIAKCTFLAREFRSWEWFPREFLPNMNGGG
jgi:hypothetical protein